MTKFLATLAQLFRGLAAVGIVVLLGIGSWFAYMTYSDRTRMSDELREKSAKIDKLVNEVGEKSKQIQQLNLALRLLKVDRRLAEIVVLEQTPANGADHGKTKFRFSEVDEHDTVISEPKVFTIAGDVVYVDGWIVKFADPFVEGADPLRSASIVFFHRLFGEYQEPQDGFALDSQNARPAVYGKSENTPFEKQIWANFWEYTQDADKAEKDGIRAAHGEAVSTRLQKGILYRLQIRASDGLSIVPLPLPPEKANGA
jgi:hypothetical protein